MGLANSQIFSPNRIDRFVEQLGQATLIHHRGVGGQFGTWDAEGGAGVCGCQFPPTIGASLFCHWTKSTIIKATS
jgi:hypothetical protein